MIKMLCVALIGDVEPRRSLHQPCWPMYGKQFFSGQPMQLDQSMFWFEYSTSTVTYISEVNTATNLKG